MRNSSKRSAKDHISFGEPQIIETSVAEALNKDIIVKRPLEEMIKYFFKDYVIIWHDPGLNSQENQGHRAQLEEFCKVFTFTEWDKARDFVQEAKEICHVITSGTNGELLVKEIFERDNVRSVYVFCANKEYHETWAKNYQKVQCVETEIQTVLSQIRHNLEEWLKREDSLKVNLPAFAPVFNDSDKSEMNSLHLYLKMIPNFKSREQAKSDFVSLSKRVYSTPNEIKLIEEFEQTYNDYNKEQTLQWYTRESFLYKMANKCLRIATSDSIQYSRLLLKDIERAIRDHYQTKSKSFHGLLYRGTYMSEGEWSSLKENKDKEIEMHGFLSVSKVKNVALNFMRRDPSKMALVTIIVPKGPNEEEQGFAEIEEYSMYPMEKEILFNVRSRFTVLEAEDDYEYSETVKCRHLVLLYGAQGFRKFMTEENPIQKILTASHDCDEKSGKLVFISIKTGLYYGKKYLDYDAAPFLCLRMKDLAEKMEIKGCLLMNANQAQTPFYGYKCVNCQTKKEKTYFTCIDCGMKWCENCSEEKASGCIEAGHGVILETSPFSFWYEKMSTNELNHLKFQNNIVRESNETFQQATMYFESHEFEKAIEYYNLYIQQNEKDLQDPNLVTSYNHMGRVYYTQGEYKKALEYYLKALDTWRSVVGDNHPKTVSFYNNIGLVYYNQGESKKALEYYLKSLELWKSAYEENVPETASFYGNIGLAYESLEDYKTALEYHLKSLSIRKAIYGESHPDVANSYNSLGSVYERQGEYKKALEYHMKSLEILKGLHGENHPFVAISYHNIGNVEKSQGEFDKAILTYYKSLEIKKALYGTKHPQIALSLHQLGRIYKIQKDYKTALVFCMGSLDIYKTFYEGENHPDIADSLFDIGMIYQDQKQYKMALEYHLNCMPIKRALYGENHINVAVSFNIIGTLYYEMEEGQKALVCFLKSLEIFKSAYGDNHPVIASTLHKIGLVYDQAEDYKASLWYYQKSLDMFKSADGDNRSEIVTSYQQIGMAYYSQGEQETALKYFLKCLDARKSLYGENHPDIAASYNNIGMAYYNQENYEKAREYYLKSLDIFESAEGDNRSEIAASYDNTGMTYFNQGEYEKALEYLFKALEIHKSVYGEIHPVITACYNKIGPAYYRQEDYDKALEYHLKCLQVEKALYGENHSSVATTYSNLGMAFCKKEEYEAALGFLLKSLNIFKSVLGESHPQTIGVHLEILKIIEIAKPEQE